MFHPFPSLKERRREFWSISLSFRSFTRSQVSNSTHHCSITSSNNETNTSTWRKVDVQHRKRDRADWPSTANVLKNAKFFVSKALSLVNSNPRDWGSDSPVSDELSTLKPCALMTRMSAGTRSPNLTSTISPTTSSSAFKFRFSPLRIANACCKRRKTHLMSLLGHRVTYRRNPKANREKRVKWLISFLQQRNLLKVMKNLHVLERFHDSRAFCFLKVREATGDEDDHR